MEPDRSAAEAPRGDPRDGARDLGLLWLRLLAGLGMASHGWDKLFGGGMEAFRLDVERMGLELPPSYLIQAAGTELLGGILLALGLASRPAAGLVFLDMSVAAFIRHSGEPFASRELALAYWTASLALALTGAGRWSLDRSLGPRLRAALGAAPAAGDWRPRARDWGLLALRVLAGLGIASHGWGKLAGGLDGFAAGLARLGFPAPGLFAWAAALSELGGGLLIALGLGTRPAALAVLATMCVAAFVRHGGEPFERKEKALAYGAAAGALLLTGAGRFSPDEALLRRLRARRAGASGPAPSRGPGPPSAPPA